MTYVAVEHTDILSNRLTKLPEEADEEALLEPLLTMPTKPLELGTANRRVTL